jgi:hypothetical protein
MQRPPRRQIPSVHFPAIQAPAIQAPAIQVPGIQFPPYKSQKFPLTIIQFSSFNFVPQGNYKSKSEVSDHFRSLFLTHHILQASLYISLEDTRCESLLVTELLLDKSS